MESPDESLCESDSINATILEYYNKFGKDRRLEKYLRIRCPAEGDTDAANSSKSCRKFEELHTSHSKPEKPKTISQSSTVGKEALADTSEAESEKIHPTSPKKSTLKSKVSNKRLEWDSLGDVGYGKPSSKDASSASSFNPNVLRFLSSTSRSKETCTETGTSIQSSQVSQSLGKQENEKWRRTLETIKKKYDKQLLDTSSCNIGALQFNTESFSALSTPITCHTNKSVQTSQVNLQCKEVQVSLPESKSVPGMLQRTTRSKSNYSTSSPSNSSTVKQRIQIDKKSPSQMSSNLNVDSNGQTDLECGINLLCLLIESKNLSTGKKKKLAKKIVTRISSKTLSDTSRAWTASSSNDNPSSISTSPLVKIASSKPGFQSSQSERSYTESSKLVLDSIQDCSKEKSPNSVTDQSNEKCSTYEKPQRATRRPKTGLNIQKTTRKMTKSRSADDVLQFMRTWLDPMTKSERKYEKDEKTRKDMRKQEKPTFVPLAPLQTVSNKQKIVLVDSQAGGDFVPTGYRRSSEVLDFITNERKSHLKWIESEIEHLKNLKQLLVKSRTNFTPCKINQQAYTTIVQNMYDQVASSCTDSMQYSEEASAPVDYRETEVVSEREEIDLNNLCTRTEVRREQEAIIYDSAGGDSTESHKTKNITVEIIEEKKLPKSHYLRPKDHAEKQLRSKLQTPPVVENDELKDFVQNRRRQFLERCKKTCSPEIKSGSSVENGHYSEPCQKPVSRHRISENVSSSTGSTQFFISSESVSIPEVETSSTTTTHQYDHQRAVGVQTTDSLHHLQRLDGNESTGVMRTYCYSKHKQTQTQPQSIAYVISFGNLDTSFNPVETKLRDYLTRRRPEFAQRINERVVILNQIRNLRREREKEIREIVENYSITSLPKKLQELPPPPTKYLRVFSTREMKARTQRKYSQLPEVAERKRRHKLDKTKKSNRIITDMFNKRIQQRVRNGKLNFEQSMTVI